MRRVRYVMLVAAMAASSGAFAQSERPRSILDVLLGRKPEVQAPTMLTPALPPPAKAMPGSRAAPSAKAAKVASPAKPKKTAKARPAKTKTEVYASAIDPGPRATPVATGYTGPFRGGGNQPVCVRLCDGYFFPVNYEGAKGSDRYAEACQASCPGTATEVYFMPRGADLTRAATARGDRYTALDTAFKYRKERDNACSCKTSGQSWADVLRNADTLVKRSKTDIVVTDDRAIGPPMPPDYVAPVDQAETARPLGKPSADLKTDMLRSVFGETSGRTNRFVRIDPETTGSIKQAYE